MLATAMLVAIMPASAFAAPHKFQGDTARGTMPKTFGAVGKSALQAGGPLAVLPDAYESDGTTATATAITFPASQSHTIHDAGPGPSTDWDGFSFTAQPGALYTFETSGTADTTIEIWDDKYGSTLGWKDDKSATDKGSKITWTAPLNAEFAVDETPRTFYVWVGPANPTTGAGDYEFTATELAGSYLPGTAKRLAGATRYSTAWAVAAEAFPSWNKSDGSPVDTVIVVNGDDAKAADPLAAAPLAGLYESPIMLVSAAAVPADTKSVLAAIKLHNGGNLRLFVIGGTGTVPATVYNALAAYKGAGGSITRISGADRYALAATIADRVSAYWVAHGAGQPSYVFVANGEKPAAFFDALAMGPVLYRQGFPLLLTKQTSVPAATSSRLAGAFSASRVHAVNSTTYLPSSVYTAIGADERVSWSSDRYWSAFDINEWAQRHYAMPSEKIAVSNKLADSLTGGAAMGQMGGGLMFTDTNFLEDAPWWYLVWRSSVIEKGYVLGGTSSITPDSYSQFASYIQ